MTDLAGPLDALYFAQRFGAEFQVRVVSPLPQVSGTFDVQITNLAPLPKHLQHGDVLIIPGALSEVEAYQSAAGQMVANWLKRVFDSHHHQIITVCSGIFLLAKAGLLNGVKCTTHHELTDDLRTQCPEALVQDDCVFTDHGAILTSAGVTAGFDVILYWLAQNFGHHIALKTARHMNVYFRRSPNDVALSPWLLARDHMHSLVHKVQDAITQQLLTHAQTHSLAHLAKIACVSPRHLNRLFHLHTGMTVHHYQLHIQHALFDQWRATGLSQEKSALRSGFSSANAWRRSQKP